LRRAETASRVAVVVVGTDVDGARKPDWRARGRKGTGVAVVHKPVVKLEPGHAERGMGKKRFLGCAEKAIRL